MRCRPLSTNPRSPCLLSYPSESNVRRAREQVRCGVGLKISQNSAGNIVVDKIQKDSAADVDGQIKVPPVTAP